MARASVRVSIAKPHPNGRLCRIVMCRLTAVRALPPASGWSDSGESRKIHGFLAPPGRRVGLRANFGAACGHCGGTVQCNAACGIADPPGLGSACGSCGGVIECSGQCSVATPADYGAVKTAVTPDSFSCCFIDETRQYGPSGWNTSGCFPGYAYAGCTVAKQSGNGVVSVMTEDPQTCTCQVHVNNTGLDGASYVDTISQIRGC
jgi:hypothetical protein